MRRQCIPGQVIRLWIPIILIAEIQRPAQTTFEQQIPLVLSWAELRNERATEILAQIDPQYAFWSSIVYLHPDRTKRTFELINMVLQFCVYVEMRFKHALACWRPVEYNAQVQPMITTPGHGAFPSGTRDAGPCGCLCAESSCCGSIRQPRYPMVIDQLDRQAARIATNRVIAGVHFPVDSMAGRMLGVALGEYFVGRCTGEPTSTMSRTFIAGEIDGHPTTDFNPFSPNQHARSAGHVLLRIRRSGTVTQSLLMYQLWRQGAGRNGRVSSS